MILYFRALNKHTKLYHNTKSIDFHPYWYCTIKIVYMSNSRDVNTLFTLKKYPDLTTFLLMWGVIKLSPILILFKREILKFKKSLLSIFSKIPKEIKWKK